MSTVYVVCFLWQSELVALLSVPGSILLDCDRYERQKRYYHVFSLVSKNWTRNWSYRLTPHPASVRPTDDDTGNSTDGVTVNKWLFFSARECGLVLRLVALVCLSVCPVCALTFESKKATWDQIWRYSSPTSTFPFLPFQAQYCQIVTLQNVQGHAGLTYRF